MRVFVEESRSSNKVVDFVSRCQSSATEYVPGRNSTFRGESNDSDHNVSIKAFTESSRIQECILPLCRIIFVIHLSC